MSRRLVLKVGKTRRQTLLQELKRAGEGLPVSELAGRLGLSYMGTKEICLDLEKAGYLSTWRTPSPRGRPKLLYRLTRKADELFATEEPKLALELLQAAAGLFGPLAPGKLLLRYFQNLEKEGAARIRGSLPAERLRWMARWRDGMGCYASFEEGPPPALLERHQPMREIFQSYPDAITMELRMLSSLAGTSLRREEASSDGSCLRRFLAE